jgi:hypothetical protein
LLFSFFKKIHLSPREAVHKLYIIIREKTSGG